MSLTKFITKSTLNSIAVLVVSLSAFVSAGSDTETDASVRKSQAIAILQEHGNYGWLSETGNFVIAYTSFQKSILCEKGSPFFVFSYVIKS